MILPAVGLDGLSTIPYIVHPLDVASILMKNNAPEHVVIAGLLHDVVEDGDYTLSDIRDEFGDEVATLVDGASEPEELINADRDMKLFSCTDKLANTLDTGILIIIGMVLAFISIILS
jgi:(p)ppGpp synthase/HD superfamily hydrolase